MDLWSEVKPELRVKVQHLVPRGLALQAAEDFTESRGAVDGPLSGPRGPEEGLMPEFNSRLLSDVNSLTIANQGNP